MASEYKAEYEQLNDQFGEVFTAKESEIRSLITAINGSDDAAIRNAQSRLETLHNRDNEIRKQADAVILKAASAAEVEDSDYVFITFVTRYLPIGLVGLLLAVIFSAAMSSTASELNALATTTVVDIYRRSLAPGRSDRHYLMASKGFTIMWGVLALIFAMGASLFDNLIEAVNIVGSVFYGTILGIFLVAFFLKRVGANAVFWGALLAEIVVITIFVLEKTDRIEIAYLWLNLIGCMLVMMIAPILQAFMKKET